MATTAPNHGRRQFGHALRARAVVVPGEDEAVLRIQQNDGQAHTTKHRVRLHQGSTAPHTGTASDTASLSVDRCRNAWSLVALKDAKEHVPKVRDAVLDHIESATTYRRD